MKKSQFEILNLIAQIIYDKKGLNILALDVQGLSSIADFILIAEGNVDRHVCAIAKGIVEELKERGEIVYHIEGLATGDWVVLDFAGIIVHIFAPSMRGKYSLEKLWPESLIVDLEIDVSKSAIGLKH